MAAAVSSVPRLTFFDNVGAPLNGGLVSTYAAGTLTPKTFYSDESKTVPISNPIVLNAAGRPVASATDSTEVNLYFTGSAKFVVKTSAGATLYTSDNIEEVAVASGASGTVLVSPTINTSILSASALLAGFCQGRLTLTSGNPVPAGDVTGATTVYFTPYLGNNIALFDGATTWTLLPFTEKSVALGTLTSGLPYDVFAYNNGGVVALRPPVAWTSASARATALAVQNGIYVKTGATTDRYLGTFFTDSTTVTSDAGAGSATSGRHLYNYYNRVPRSVSRVDPSGGWNYTTATVRQANGNTANQVQIMQGVAETPITLALNTSWSNTNAGGGVNIMVGIGEDSTTTTVVGDVETTSIANGNMGLHALLSKVPSVGHHVYSWNEWSVAVSTSSCVGASATGSNQAYGLYGTVWA